MKLWLALVLVLLAGVVQAETLALTVKTVNADPGEEGVNYQVQYFVDEEGHLVREHVERFDEGSPVADQVYRWTADGVAWEVDATNFRYSYAIRNLKDHLVRTLNAKAKVKGSKDYAQTTTIAYLEGPGTRWQDGTKTSIWEPSTGFQQQTLPDKASARSVRYTTKAGLLSRWISGSESDRASLDRKTDKLTATLLGMFLIEKGWVATGTSVLTGPGLWNIDPMVNLMHAVILDRYGELPLWVPFVFEKGYLK